MISKYRKSFAFNSFWLQQYWIQDIPIHKIAKIATQAKNKIIQFMNTQILELDRLQETSSSIEVTEKNENFWFYQKLIDLNKAKQGANLNNKIPEELRYYLNQDAFKMMNHKILARNAREPFKRLSHQKFDPHRNRPS